MHSKCPKRLSVFNWCSVWVSWLPYSQDLAAYSKWAQAEDAWFWVAAAGLNFFPRFIGNQDLADASAWPCSSGFRFLHLSSEWRHTTERSWFDGIRVLPSQLLSLCSSLSILGTAFSPMYLVFRFGITYSPTLVPQQLKSIEDQICQAHFD